jgi:hypothetical protein
MTKNQKGVQALVALAALSTVCMQTAHAENKLFATDVLDRGQVDIEITQLVSETKSETRWTAFAETDSTKISGSESVLAARVGVGAQTHVGAALAYAVTRARTQYELAGFSVPDSQSKAKGFQGWSLWVKHGFLASTSSPLSLAAGLQVDLETDRNLGGEANNTASASVSAGWDFGSGVKGFADVTQHMAEHGKVGQSTGITAGAWLPAGGRVTLEPSVNLVRVPSRGLAPSVNLYGVALQGLVQLANNTYLRGNLTAFTSDGLDAKDGSFHVDAATGKSLSIGLYHLF